MGIQKMCTVFYWIMPQEKATCKIGKLWKCNINTDFMEASSEK